MFCSSESCNSAIVGQSEESFSPVDHGNILLPVRSFTSIHPSAWKRNSRKLTVHIPGPPLYNLFCPAPSREVRQLSLSPPAMTIV